jgi:hypothetical protein
MTDTDNQMAESHRSAWTTPVIRRLAAGSAEDGADNTFDGAQPS